MIEALGPYRLGPNGADECGVYVGDSRILAAEIPDGSVDVIVTDPVYGRIEDYRWLAETGARVLKSDSSCFAFCGIEWLPEVLRAVEDGGLSYRWTFAFPFAQKRSGFWSGWMRRGWIAGVWWEKGRARLAARIHDSMTIPSARGGRASVHRWEKGQRWLRYVVRGFVKAGDVVWDPFLGSGGTLVLGRECGARVLGFEIEGEVAELARRQLRRAQPPLGLRAEEEQLTMELVA